MRVSLESVGPLLLLWRLSVTRLLGIRWRAPGRGTIAAAAAAAVLGRLGTGARVGSGARVDAARTREPAYEPPVPPARAHTMHPYT